MANMYHHTDPEIESVTYNLRKQFHDTIREMKRKGQHIQNIEAFLVNTSDMDKLGQLFHGNNFTGSSGGIDPLDGQMKMYGVKIIESPYIPEGTIFKVFKNDQQQPFLSPSVYGIPSWDFSKEQVEDSILTTSINVDNITTADIKKNMENAIEAVNKAIDDPVPQGHTPPKEKRHSNKRRIELDE